MLLQSTHLPQFISPIPEPRALAIDALTHDWQGLSQSMYMFPLFALFNKVIQKLCATQDGDRILIVIDPWWPSQPYFPHLLGLCVDHTIIPYHRDPLSQQGFISVGKLYHLHEWRLSCSTIRQQDFQKSSLGSRVRASPQTACRMTGGFASVTGLQDRELIRLVPQLLK